MMQSAETTTFGRTQRGGPAAVMQSAADMNEHAGLLGHEDVSDIPGDTGVSVAQTDLPGCHLIIESVGGEPVGQYPSPAPVGASSTPVATETLGSEITIGEALEATALTAGEKPVLRSDAAAIQAAEARVAGVGVAAARGLAAEAQSAAAANEMAMRDENKTKLSDVLTLPGDKAATREDAERVTAAELRNNPAMATHPSGVAESVAAAARLNRKAP